MRKHMKVIFSVDNIIIIVFDIALSARPLGNGFVTTCVESDKPPDSNLYRVSEKERGLGKIQTVFSVQKLSESGNGAH